MGMPNPDYDEDGRREKRISFLELENKLSEELRLVVGEELQDAEVEDDSIVFELHNPDVE